MLARTLLFHNACSWLTSLSLNLDRTREHFPGAVSLRGARCAKRSSQFLTGKQRSASNCRPFSRFSSADDRRGVPWTMSRARVRCEERKRERGKKGGRERERETRALGQASGSCDREYRFDEHERPESRRKHTP